LYRQAAADLSLSLAGALFVGDRQRDVEPGITLGGVAILVPSAFSPEPEVDWSRAHALVLPALADAVAHFAAAPGRYLP
jgi:FMN phosphatase YigB (HAD superfamily)